MPSAPLALALALGWGCSSKDADTDGETGDTGTTSAATTQQDTDTTTTPAPETTSGTTSSSDTTSTGGTTSDAATSGPMCDPDNPDMMVRPMAEEQPGDPCCTTETGCSGMDTGGMIPQTSELGDLMECVDGKWEVDPDSDFCAGECPAGTNYIGCFWWGPLRECGCQ